MIEDLDWRIEDLRHHDKLLGMGWLESWSLTGLDLSLVEYWTMHYNF